MATSFKIQKTISIVPTETVTLDDGADTSLSINSNLDSTFGSYINQTMGATGNKLYSQTGISVGASSVLSTLVTSLGASDVMGFLFIKLVTAGGGIAISFDGSGTVKPIYLMTAGDFFCSTMDLDVVGSDAQGQDIYITKVGAAATIDVFIVES